MIKTLFTLAIGFILMSFVPETVIAPYCFIFGCVTEYMIFTSKGDTHND